MKHNLILAIAFSFLILCILSLGTVSAVDRTVTSGTTFDDINNTISISGNNDRILLGSTTYTSNGNQMRVVNKTGLIIQGTSDSQRAVLNAGHQNRIIVVDENSTVTFRYIDFINGNSGNTSGAAIHVSNTIIVENCSFRNNWGESGGAIFIRPEAEHCFIINSSFISNEGRYVGDDVWVEGGAVDSHGNYTSIMDCIFQGNSALTIAGAVNFASDTIGNKLISCDFVNNHAPRGGALRVGVRDVLIENCTFTNNYANESHGGAIFIGNSEVTIKGCVFTNNRAVFNGGAIYNDGSSSFSYLNISNVTFDGNQGVNGGAIYSQSQLSINNSSFISNRANGVNAGGVYASNAILVQNSNFRSNVGSGLVLMGVGTNIFNNNFSSNSGYGLRATDLRNSVINVNTFRNNGGAALYIVGNGNRVITNSFLSNGLGIRIDGSSNNISNNIVDGNLAQGIYLIGNNNYIGFNDIKNNKRNAIWVRGSSVAIERNNITKNSVKGYSTVYINGANAKVIRNNISSNRHRGVEITGNGASVLNNVFNNNVDTHVWIKGNTILINSNSISVGTAYGIYLIGNSVNITSNTVNNNRLDGIYVVGNKTKIKSNTISNNKGRGLYLKGSNCDVSYNTINNNVKNAIRGIGNKNIFNSNKLNNNSIKGKFCAVYFEGNQNTYKNNNLTNNGYHGLHIIGSSNTVSKNYCDNNKDSHIVVQGNKNKVSENKGYNGKNNGLHISGSSNNVTKNILNKNKNGIFVKGSSNKLNGNYVQSNSNYGVYTEGSKNSFIQNVIRSNNVGIYHANGKTNKFNHNNIVNKKQNLFLKKGSVNAEYNWWGQNKVAKVKNHKVSRYVISKIGPPKVSYLKLNKYYSVSVVLKDDKNKNLARNIPAMNVKFAFSKKVGNKSYASYISHKNKTLVNNKATVTIKADEHRVHVFTKVIDNQKLSKTFYPPCDLKVFMVANPNPTIQGFVVTYTVYVNNLGPGDGYNVSVSTNLPKLKNASYSFSGSKWNKMGKTINMGRINKGQTKYVYIRGALDSKFYGNIKSTATVKSSTHDLKSSNNKYTVTLKVLKYNPKSKSKKYLDVFANCGPVAMQHLLASKGIFVSKKVLISKLKPVKGQVSMYMMRKVAAEYGVNLNAVKTPLKTLKKGDVVLVNISGQMHYVTIQSIGKDYVIFNDPVLGPIKIPRKDFDKWYTGYTLSTENKGKDISEDKQKDLLGGILPVIIVIVIGGVVITLTAAEIVAICIGITGLIIIGYESGAFAAISKGLNDLVNWASSKVDDWRGDKNVQKAHKEATTLKFDKSDGQRLVEGLIRICGSQSNPLVKSFCNLGYIGLSILAGELGKSFGDVWKLNQFKPSKKPYPTRRQVNSYGYVDNYGVFHLQYGTRTDNPNLKNIKL